MQSKLTAVLAAFVLALCAYAPGAASAQTGSIYTVSGVNVDVTVPNAAAAQQTGFAEAHRLAFQRLLGRITLPGDLAASNVRNLDAASIERLVASVDVADERRSGTRYLGRFTVRFDANGVRNLLRSQNLTILETRTAPTLIVPTVGGGTAEDATLWREAFTQGGYGDELAPLAIAPETLQGAANWNTAAPFAQTAGAPAALYATLRVQGAALTVTVDEATSAGVRSWGQFTARATSTDPAAMRAAMGVLAAQVNERVQGAWRTQAMANAGQQGRIAASALYANQQQWERIKQALEGAAQTMISEIRIEAVGRDGALVSFSFRGQAQQLAEELERRGVRLAQGVNGWELRTAGR